jgi:hypothetical protein
VSRARPRRRRSSTTGSASSGSARCRHSGARDEQEPFDSQSSCALGWLRGSHTFLQRSRHAHAASSNQPQACIQHCPSRSSCSDGTPCTDRIGTSRGFSGCFTLQPFVVGTTSGSARLCYIAFLAVVLVADMVVGMVSMCLLVFGLCYRVYWVSTHRSPPLLSSLQIRLRRIREMVNAMELEKRKSDNDRSIS